MALAIDITDEKGVKTRYHAIKGFIYEHGNLIVKIFGYVNKETRDAEKNAIENNKRVAEYNARIEDLQNQLDAIMPLNDDQNSKGAKIAELADKINELMLAPDRPQVMEVIDRNYNESEVTIDYFEPLSIDAIYNKLALEGTYKGAKTV